MNSFTLPDEAAAQFNLDPSAMEQPWYAGSVASVRKRLRSIDHACQIRRGSKRDVRITLLDTFDWQLLHHGWAAIAVEGPDTETPDIAVWAVRSEAWSQRPVGSGEQLYDVRRPSNKLLSAAATTIAKMDLSGRALLDLGSVAGTVSHVYIVNASEKTIGVALELNLSGSHRFLRFSPLKGYAPRMTDVIRAADLTRPTDPIEIVELLASQRGRHPFDYDTHLQLPMTKDDTLQSAHRQIVPVLCRTMAANRRGIEEQIDTEFLHDYRVALRRLRSYVREAGIFTTALAKESVVHGIDAVWDASGEARDLDVFLARHRRYRSVVPQALLAEVDTVFDRVRGAKDASYRAFLSVLPDRFEERLELDLLHCCPSSIEAAEAASARLDEMATRWVARRERRFLKRVRRLQEAYVQCGSEIDDERIHDARKSAKKLRYLQEIFLPVLTSDSSAHKRVTRLRRLQNLLGDYNDLVVEERRFLQLLSSDSPDSFQDDRGAIAYMLATVEREKEVARAQVLAELRKETS